VLAIRRSKASQKQPKAKKNHLQLSYLMNFDVKHGLEWIYLMYFDVVSAR
jgi:hypothetical protein